MTFNIVFDLDDTLYPERDFALMGFAGAVDWARTRYGLTAQATDALTADMVRRLDGGQLGPLFAAALRATRPDAVDDDVRAFAKAFGSASLPRLALFPDAERCLARLASAASHRIAGLITDGSGRVQATKIAALGIADRFPIIVRTGDLGPDRAFHKPHPRGFEMVAAAGGQAGRYVYVGDNIQKDFIAPNALGWFSVHIVRPDVSRIHAAATGPAPPGGAPHITLASLDDLEGALSRVA